MVREISYDSISQREKGSQIYSSSNMGKVTNSSNGILVPDQESRTLVNMYTSGKVINKLPMSQPSVIALSYDEGHQVFYQFQTSNQLKHLLVSKTAPSASPKALAQKYVQAYLDGDEKSVLDFSSSRMFLRLTENDAQIREAFNNISSYQEVIFMYGLEAEVRIETMLSGVASIGTFHFVWKNGKWFLSGLM